MSNRAAAKAEYEPKSGDPSAGYIGADNAKQAIDLMYDDIEQFSKSGNNVNAGGGLPAGTTGTQNTALGHAALLNNTSGPYNTALGCATLRANTTGESNIAIGRETLTNNTEGSYNIAVGGVGSAR